MSFVFVGKKWEMSRMEEGNNCKFTEKSDCVIHILLVRFLAKYFANSNFSINFKFF